MSKIQTMIDKKDNDIKETISLKILQEKNLINKKYARLKILANGDLKKH